jgi:HlyD family secretion protein
MTPRLSDGALTRLRRRALLACAAILVPGALLLALPVDGAVIAPAILTPESGARAVQHREGGRAAEILVKDGDRVTRGQVLIRLDATEARAAHRALEHQIAAVEARIARLEAETGGAREVAMPSNWLILEEETEPAGVLESERALFVARYQARQAERARREARKREIDAELAGLTSLSAAREGERAILADQLEALDGLYRKGLTTMPRVNAVKRDRARIEGDLAQIAAETARLFAERAGLEQEGSEAESAFLAKATEELAAARLTLADLSQKRLAAEERVAQLDIVAPEDGIVHGLALHASGGTIPPGAAVARIVPLTDDLVAELRVPVREIDRLHDGEAVRIRLQSGPSRLAHPIEARIAYIAPDATRDPDTGASWYVVRATFNREAASDAAGTPLTPGMTAEAYLSGTPRSIGAYLIEPLTEQAGRALRER